MKSQPVRDFTKEIMNHRTLPHHLSLHRRHQTQFIQTRNFVHRQPRSRQGFGRYSKPLDFDTLIQISERGHFSVKLSQGQVQSHEAKHSTSRTPQN